MAWITHQNGDMEPDGKPFDQPADSFEAHYNEALASGNVDHDEMDVSNGWPLSTHAAEPKPRSSEEVRLFLDAHLAPYNQQLALEAGNTHDELDKIAKQALAWALYFKTPLTHSEKNLAKRLGLEPDKNPDQADSRERHHSLGI
jgi:hypothetical protein